MTEFKYLSLAEAHKATGIVLVIDVLRAFTSAAYALHAGAIKIHPVDSVEKAIRLRESFSGAFIMGEVDGIKPKGFDFGNSPAEISTMDLRGRILIQRTSAGTQGIVRAKHADRLFAASFVVAGATAQHIRSLDPAMVSVIVTGESLGRDGDEDRACGEYIQALIMGGKPDSARYTQRVFTSSVGRSFLSGNNHVISGADFDLCTKLDRFSFSLPIRREGTLFVLERGLL